MQTELFFPFGGFSPFSLVASPLGTARYCLLLLVFFLAAPWLLGQQDAQYTQFMDMKLAYNPAFSGASSGTEIQALARQQWVGLDGAPSSQVLTFNTPFTASGTGLGAVIGRQSLGLENNYTGTLSYAYRIQLRRGARIGLGISASARQFTVDFQDASPIQGGGVDQSIPLGQETKIVPNFGAGIYFDSPKFYAGISAPRLLENNIDFTSTQTIISREVRHLYAMAGLSLLLSEQFQLQPQLLVKLVEGAPFDADFNLTAALGRSVELGASYRLGGSKESGLGESISLLAAFFVSNKLQLGMAYDLGMSELRQQHNGSIGIRLRYLVRGRPAPITVVDPRG